MKTPIRFATCALAIALGWMTVQAADPTPAARPNKGRVLVLDNEHTLEGDIDLVGDQYRIRHSVGETWVSAAKALHLCQDAGEAYTYLRSRINLDDADERLRLADWCHMHELRDQALAEVKAAVELRPDHLPTRRLLNQLQQSAAAAAQAHAVPPSPASVDSLAALPPIDLNNDSLGKFVTRVQPILMNACMSCHGGNYQGQFKLSRVYENSGATRRSTQQNLAVVLAQLSLDKPTMSPLLVKAITAHDEAAVTSPLKGRTAPAYVTLEEWVQTTLANNPQLQDRNKTAATGTSKAETKVTAEVKPAAESKPAVMAPPPHGEFAIAQVSASGTAGMEPARTATSEPANAGPLDEFDPVIFNRQMHGDKKN